MCRPPVCTTNPASTTASSGTVRGSTRRGARIQASTRCSATTGPAADGLVTPVPPPYWTRHGIPPRPPLPGRGAGTTSRRPVARFALAARFRLAARLRLVARGGPT
ncbi:hypothetical protein GCM10010210_32380 [Pseudonocardia hydrocarbonoxydans]|uniref:Uncharacterized protein n=1 Tax=Pseudonocardia hydrocarbonoxydans TaxID=76726 RepID=A0A4Y3WK09_9PSEU|nr:hypothetical protein PHY01_05320 [Pseudonocardia hydrocarbonoxydans]